MSKLADDPDNDEVRALYKRIAELEGDNAAIKALPDKNLLIRIAELEAQLNDCGTWAFDMCIARGGLEEQIKAVQVYLPKITNEIRAEFEDTCLMENDGTQGWSQEAVDFGCLLNSTLATAKGNDSE